LDAIQAVIQADVGDFGSLAVVGDVVDEEAVHLWSVFSIQ
jgi:hypothetical protein